MTTTTTQIEITTEEQAARLGQLVREEVIRLFGGVRNRCVFASMVAVAVAGGELHDGTIPGEWEESGDHTIAKCGEWHIDATADQFGMDDVMVFTDSDRAKYCDFDAYEAFGRCSQIPASEKVLAAAKRIAEIF